MSVVRIRRLASHRLIFITELGCTTNFLQNVQSYSHLAFRSERACASARMTETHTASRAAILPRHICLIAIDRSATLRWSKWLLTFVIRCSRLHPAQSDDEQTRPVQGGQVDKHFFSSALQIPLEQSSALHEYCRFSNHCFSATVRDDHECVAVQRLVEWTSRPRNGEACRLPRIPQSNKIRRNSTGTLRDRYFLPS